MRIELYSLLPTTDHLYCSQQDYTAEVEHDTAVTALALSPDGRNVLCTTAGGTVGQLSLDRQTYQILTRSHTGAIAHAVANTRRTRLATASADGTIRMWTCAPTLPAGLRQLYEFAVCVHVCGGFAGGLMEMGCCGS